jgi:putative Ca2+/H+ antiporter (TMEM165/GDT1 family)
VNFAVVSAVFAFIFVGELPDKTMVASLVMSTRGTPRSSSPAAGGWAGSSTRSSSGW